MELAETESPELPMNSFQPSPELLTSETLGPQFAAAFFWGAGLVTAMVPYDIQPVTEVEIYFTTVCMLVGLMINAFAIGSAASALASSMPPAPAAVPAAPAAVPAAPALVVVGAAAVASKGGGSPSIERSNARFASTRRCRRRGARARRRRAPRRCCIEVTSSSTVGSRRTRRGCAREMNRRRVR